MSEKKKYKRSNLDLFQRERQRFSIRKFKQYGAASVLLGSLIFGVNLAAEADEITTDHSEEANAEHQHTSGTQAELVETESLVVSTEGGDDTEASLSASSSQEVSSETSSSALPLTVLPQATETTESGQEASSVGLQTEEATGASDQVGVKTTILTYIVQYVDKETGEVLASLPRVKRVDSREAVPTVEVTEFATDRPRGYKLASGQLDVLVQTIVKGEQTTLTFFVEKDEASLSKEQALNLSEGEADGTSRVLIEPEKTVVANRLLISELERESILAAVTAANGLDSLAAVTVGAEGDVTVYFNKTNRKNKCNTYHNSFNSASKAVL